MSNIIGLTSIRPSGESLVFVQVSELVNETLFALDRVMRSAVRERPWAEWPFLAARLNQEGYTSVTRPGEHAVFVHSRPWDEHLVTFGESFFVTFADGAPYELAGQLMLASPYPHFYGGVSADYIRRGAVVLLDANHDPVYPDDLAWESEEHLQRRPLGPVELIEEQFSSKAQMDAARRSLEASGYQLA
jgi:hypothetical protein